MSFFRKPMKRSERPGYVLVSWCCPGEAGPRVVAGPFDTYGQADRRRDVDRAAGRNVDEIRYRAKDGTLTIAVPGDRRGAEA